MKRRVGAHVEDEDRSWDSAINLMLEIEGVSTNLISHAYFPFISSNAAWGYTNKLPSSKGASSESVSQLDGRLLTESEKLSYNVVLREGLLRSLRKLAAASVAHFGPPAAADEPSSPASTSSMGIGSVLGALGLGSNRYVVQGGSGSPSSGPSARLNFTQRAMSTAARPVASFGIRSTLPSAIPSRETDNEDQFMLVAQESATALGHAVAFPGKVGYRVSNNHVSFHIPLQRIVSKFFKYACLTGLDVADAILFLKYDAPRTFVNSIADFPLRCLSLISQVSTGMWKRNGLAVTNVAYNYNRPIFSKTFRYADLHSIQLAVLLLGEDPVIALALDRFELKSYLEGDSDLSLTSELFVEFKGPLLAEFLKFFSNLVLYVPTIVASGWEVHLSADRVETLPKAVAREVVHHVLVGDTRRGDGFSQVIKPVSFSSMLRVKNVVATSKHVTESIVRSACADYCVQKQGNADEEESAGYDLSEKGIRLIDLEYGCWTSEEQQRAYEKIREIHKRKSDKHSGGKVKSSKPFFQPIICAEAIPNAHPSFMSVRRALYRPLTFSILEKSLALCSLQENRAGLLRKCYTAIVCRVLHLVTLQLLCLATFDVSTATTQDSTASTSGYANPIAEQFYTTSFRPSTGEGYRLLVALGKLWDSKLLKDEEVYQSGLGWILSQLYQRSGDAKSVLEGMGISFSDSADQQDAQAAQANLAKKKAAAQQRALTAMSKQAMSFSATIDGDDDDEGGKDDSMNAPNGDSANSSSSSLEDGALDCIMCRDKNGGMIGYLCYLQPSSVLSNAIKQCSSDDVVESMKQVYRVVALGGCKVHARNQDTAPVVSQLNHGDHIRVKQRVGVWLEIIAPIHGWVAYYAPNPKYNTGLPTGVAFPYIVQLTRVLDLTFFKHGPSRVHGNYSFYLLRNLLIKIITNDPISFYSVYLWSHDACELLGIVNSENVSRRFLYMPVIQLIIAGMNNEYTCRRLNVNPNMIDTAHGERVCPFCKGLCNTLLPHIPPHLSELPASAATGTSESYVVKSLRSADKVTSESLSSIMDQLTARRSLSATAAHVDSISVLTTGLSVFTGRIRDLYAVPWYNQSTEPFANILEQNILISRTRSLFSIWSSAAYTILTEVVSAHSVMNASINSLEDSRMDETFSAPFNGFLQADKKAIIVSHQLLASSALLPHAFSDEFLDSAVRVPLRLLISGQQPSLFKALGLSETADMPAQALKMLTKFSYTKRDIWSIMVTLPFGAVVSNSYPDVRRLAFVLQLFQDACPHEALWGWLLKPLLDQDLHTVLVAAVGVSSSIHAVGDLCCMLSLARLVQCLMEPSCSGIYKSELGASAGSESSSKRRKSDGTPISGSSDKYPFVRAPEVTRLIPSITALRDAVYAEAQLPVDSGAATEGAELLETVLESLVLFLEFAVCVRSRMSRANVEQSGTDGTSMDYDESVPSVNQGPRAKVDSVDFLPRVESLLALLGLPPMNELLESPRLKEYAQIWTHQYTLAQSFLLPKISSRSMTAAPVTTAAPTIRGRVSSFSRDSPSVKTTAPLLSQMTEAEDDFTGNVEDVLNEGPGATESDDAEGSDDDEPGGGDDGISDEALQPAIMTGAETLEDLLMHLLAQPNVTDEEVGMYLEAHASQSAGANPKAAKETMWRLVGVDPSLPFIDDHPNSLFSVNELRSVPSVTPFQGSLTGQYACFGLSGGAFPSFICDMSHFGVKARHRVGLIPLPRLYTDIYHSVSIFYLAV